MLEVLGDAGRCVVDEAVELVHPARGECVRPARVPRPLFLVQGLLDRLVYLSTGLAVILTSSGSSWSSIGGTD
jgi:hypothetical protein